MGNRFRGGIAPGAMPPLHRYLGNPVLSWIGRLFFRISIGDFHCGLRGFNTEAIRRCGLKTTGMEFASEMVVKASLYGLSMAEVPTTLARDGRSRPPHLRTWRDGWRHLCFLLTYAPHWLYMYPALALMGVGLLGVLLLLSGPLSVGSVTFANKSFMTFAMLLMLGMQVMGLGSWRPGWPGRICRAGASACWHAWPPVTGWRSWPWPSWSCSGSATAIASPPGQVPVTVIWHRPLWTI